MTSNTPKISAPALSINAKLSVILALSTLLVLLAMLSYVGLFRGQLIEDRGQEIAADLQAEVDNSIRYKIDMLLTNVLSLARNEQLQAALAADDPARARSLLTGLIADYNAADLRATQFHLIRANGTSFWRSFSDQRDDDVSQRPMIARALGDGKVAHGIEIGSSGPRLGAVAPVRDASGRLLGAIEMLLGVGSVSRQLRAGGAFYILLVERDLFGHGLAADAIEQRRVGDRYLTADAKWFDDETLAFARSIDYERLRAGQPLLGSEYFGAASPALDSAGKVYGLHVVGMTRAGFDHVTEAVFQLANHLLIGVAALLIALSTMLILLIRRLVVHPVRALSAFLLGLNNQLHHRFSWHSRDEIGLVADSVNGLLESLERAMTRVRDESRQLAAASNQLHVIAQGIAERAGLAHDQATGVAAAGEELAATSLEVANNCHAAADGANNARQSTQNGFGLVQHAVSGMRERGENTRRHAEMVSTLGERSEQIKTIVATIEAIANQTNLLALNAAIEAARAGDHGRGFAVVADEVRALARRTTSATQEISAMIGAIHQETEQAIASLGAGARDAEQAAEDASRIEAALSAILDDVNMVTDQITQIATAAEEQTAVTSDIARNMTHITEAAEGNSAAATELTSASVHLRELAVTLQREMAAFQA